MDQIEITRRLGELIVITYNGKLTVDSVNRIQAEIKRCISDNLPIILDHDMKIETICTLETMHADYSARFGDA